MNKVINFKQKFSTFSELWSPKILTQFDNYHIKAAKMKGEFIWHHHDNADELFIVISGILTIHFRDSTVDLHPGECFVVPKGVVHKTVALEETHVLFIEPEGTLNTGSQDDSQKKATAGEWI